MEYGISYMEYEIWNIEHGMKYRTLESRKMTTCKCDLLQQLGCLVSNVEYGALNKDSKIWNWDRENTLCVMYCEMDILNFISHSK